MRKNAGSSGYKSITFRLPECAIQIEYGDLAWLHTMVSNLKRELDGTYFQVSVKYTDLYLAEFCYRFNRRGKGELNFENLMAAMFQ